MKQSLRLSISLLVLTIGSFAQSAETFDIATFRIPAGWTKQATQHSLQISTEDKESAYCLITLFKAIPAVGSADENFQASWDTIVKEAVTVNAKPQMMPSDNREQWKALGGFSPFEKEGQKGVAVLLNISGHGKMVNVLVLTNTQKFEPNITAFLESISLETPEGAPKQQTAGGSDASAIVGVWGISASAQSNFAVNHGIAGYIQKQYTFRSNGTYEFLVKTFSYTMANLLFKKETGTYQLSDNSLTIIPQKGYIQAWTKATVADSTGKRSQTDNWGKLVSTQATKLEKVVYQVTKHYFSGIQEWQLVMQASKPTERDGPFTGNATFANSWLYRTQKYPIKVPE